MEWRNQKKEENVNDFSSTKAKVCRKPLVDFKQ